MKDNWSDIKFATDWDVESAVSNPTRSMLLDLLVSIVEDSYVEGNKILDLGFGSGHLEKMLFERLPKAEIVGVDASEVMIDKAKERLKDKNIITIKSNLNNINALVLPEGKYQFAVTSFVLHEIPPVHKREIFEYLYKTLVPGGMYILVDRFKIDSGDLKIPYASQWIWQRRVNNRTGTLSFDQYTEEMSAKQDSPDSIEEQLDWLRQVGFKAECLQLQLDRGLIVGVK